MGRAAWAWGLFLAWGCSTAAYEPRLLSPEGAGGGGGPAEAGNRLPVIGRLSADAQTVPPGGVASLRVEATDADRDSLAFEWTASAGRIDPQGAAARWEAPVEPGRATVAVVVRDGRGGAATAQLVLGECARVLVDASHDGGVWWYPQVAPFDAAAPHQGKALADLLRARGFPVDEVGRGEQLTDALLSRYRMVIRTAGFSSYATPELEAYERLLRAPVSLLLIAEFLRPGETDQLADRLGVPFAGIARGLADRFAPHPVTDGVASLDYSLAGSVVLAPESRPDLEVLGWLSAASFADLDDDGLRDPSEPAGAAVMGVLHHPTARVFFLGDLNGLESLPQPFTDNLLGWAFACGGGAALHGP